MPKFLDENGLSYLWGKIKDLISGNRSMSFAISEDMFELSTDATKGVSPYSTSYGYTNITIKEDAGIEWIEGATYSFVLNTKVAASAYRNVRVRIGEADSWHPLCEYNTAICVGSTHFIKAMSVIFVYKTTLYSYGALHRLYDANTTTNYYTGYCSTAAATAVKIATGVPKYGALQEGLYTHIGFTAANTAKNNVALNWNSLGAKPLYLNGQPIDANNYSIPIGYWPCYYDGEVWHVRTDGKHANPTLNIDEKTISEWGFTKNGGSLTSHSFVLEKSKWIENESGYSQVLSVEGIKDDDSQAIFVTPKPSQMDAYASFGIRAIEQNENTLLFTANEAADDITIYIAFN